MTIKAKVTSRHVLNALWQLDFDNRGTNVTTEDVARYLVMPAEEVAPLLIELEATRIARRRRRGGRQVWHPWRGQR